LFGSGEHESAIGIDELRDFLSRLFARSHTYGWPEFEPLYIGGSDELVWFVAPTTVVVKDEDGNEEQAPRAVEGSFRAMFEMSPRVVCAPKGAFLAALGVAQLLELGERVVYLTTALRLEAFAEGRDGCLRAGELDELGDHGTNCRRRVVLPARQLGVRRLRALRRLQTAHLVSQPILGGSKRLQASLNLGDALCAQRLLDVALRLVGFFRKCCEAGTVAARRRTAATPSAPLQKRARQHQYHPGEEAPPAHDGSLRLQRATWGRRLTPYWGFKGRVGRRGDGEPSEDAAKMTRVRALRVKADD